MNINENNDNTMLKNFMNYCKNKIEDNEFITLFSEMLIYDDYLIYKDVLNDVLKIRIDKLNMIAKNTEDYHVYKYKYEELPAKAIYLNKDKIRQNTNIWFVDRKNFLKIIIMFRSDKNMKIINYLLELENMLIKFLKEYGNTYMIEKQHLTDEIRAHILKIGHIEKEMNECKNRIMKMNLKKIGNYTNAIEIKEDFMNCLNKIVPMSCNSSLLEDSDDSEDDNKSENYEEDEDDEDEDQEEHYMREKKMKERNELCKKYGASAMEMIRRKKTAQKKVEKLCSMLDT